MGRVRHTPRQMPTGKMAMGAAWKGMKVESRKTVDSTW